jgi:sugar phosphate isomerase/epimerase
MKKIGWPKIVLGLNPYGVSYFCGLQGRDTIRENPKGVGLEGFIGLGIEMGAKVLEIFDPWLTSLPDKELVRLRQRLEFLGIVPVVSGRYITSNTDSVFRSAELLRAKVIRFALTDILCGNRSERKDWSELNSKVKKSIEKVGARAGELGISIAIENHQDFTSSELVEFCNLDPSVGLTFDTGNTFPVAEAPLDFTRRVAPYVRHLHLKDYRIQFNEQGFRLVRCTIGSGAVPFGEIFEILGEHMKVITAVLEPGALESRQVNLFTPNWWKGYSKRPAEDLAACLLAAQSGKMYDGENYKTPWENQNDAVLIQYELDMIRHSFDNMNNIGID